MRRRQDKITQEHKTTLTRQDKKNYETKPNQDKTTKPVEGNIKTRQDNLKNKNKTGQHQDNTRLRPRPHHTAQHSIRHNAMQGHTTKERQHKIKEAQHPRSRSGAWLVGGLD
jgi:hypothetical protein